MFHIVKLLVCDFNFWGCRMKLNKKIALIALMFGAFSESCFASNDSGWNYLFFILPVSGVASLVVVPAVVAYRVHNQRLENKKQANDLKFSLNDEDLEVFDEKYKPLSSWIYSHMSGAFAVFFVGGAAKIGQMAEDEFMRRQRSSVGLNIIPLVVFTEALILSSLSLASHLEDLNKENLEDVKRLIERRQKKALK